MGEHRYTEEVGIVTVQAYSNVDSKLLYSTGAMTLVTWRRPWRELCQKIPRTTLLLTPTMRIQYTHCIRYMHGRFFPDGF